MPEVLTKQPDFCKMAKRLEISWGAIPREFESRRLRQIKQSLVVAAFIYILKINYNKVTVL